MSGFLGGRILWQRQLNVAPGTGDTLVQNGTNKSLHNRGTEPCVIGTVMCASEPWLILAAVIAIYIVVTATLLSLPFGKLFHVFQRPAQLSVTFYKRASAQSPPAVCAAYRYRSRPQPGCLSPRRSVS